MNREELQMAFTDTRPAADSLIDMKFITSDCLFTDKWIYKLISLGKFPKPIKLGRMSRWRAADYYAWRDSHSVSGE
nr:AlpA family phage regulatory protein [Cronobacter sakazakii]